MLHPNGPNKPIISKNELVLTKSPFPCFQSIVLYRYSLQVH